MPFLHFDGKYAPCGFLIVQDDADPYSDDPKDTVLIDSDWDFPGVASTLGWVACKCGETDGTVDCEKCGRTTSEMIGEAYDYCYEREGESFDELADYF